MSSFEELQRYLARVPEAYDTIIAHALGDMPPYQDCPPPPPPSPRVKTHFSFFLR
jgi:hypothetical protein